MYRLTLIALLSLSALACHSQEGDSVTRLDLATEDHGQRTLAFRVLEDFAPPEHAPRELRILRSAEDFQGLFGARAPEGVDFKASLLVWSGEGRPAQIRAQGRGLQVIFVEGAPALAHVAWPAAQDQYAAFADMARRLL